MTSSPHDPDLTQTALDPGGIRLAVYTALLLLGAGGVVVAALLYLLLSRPAAPETSGAPHLQDRVRELQRDLARTQAALEEARLPSPGRRQPQGELQELRSRLQRAHTQRRQIQERAGAAEARAGRLRAALDAILEARSATGSALPESIGPEAPPEAPAPPSDPVVLPELPALSTEALREQLRKARRAVHAARRREAALKQNFREAQDRIESLQGELADAQDAAAAGAEADPAIRDEVERAVTGVEGETITHLTNPVLLAVLAEALDPQDAETIEEEAPGLVHCRMHGTYVAVLNQTRSLTLYTALPEHEATVEDLNAFEREVRFVSAFFDTEGAACLQLDLLIRGGITRGTLAEHIRLYRAALGRFKDQIAPAADRRPLPLDMRVPGGADGEGGRPE
jgi:predicted nuclease with TOPRIM domain